jgi:hypothetical protein
LRNDAKVREQQRQQAERRGTFAPDQSLPNPGTTFYQHALTDAATPRGRYSAIEATTVVGANPTIDYPAGPAWSADPGSQLLEPSLGWDNPALEEPSAAHSASVEQTGPTSDAPTPLGQRDVGPSFNELGLTPAVQDTGDPALGSPSPSAGSSSFRRRRL